jgi:hypothetical protein
MNKYDIRIEKGDTPEKFSQFLKELANEVTGVCVALRGFSSISYINSLSTFTWDRIGGPCYKATLLTEIFQRKISKFEAANIFLVFSRVRDPFDDELEKIGAKPLIGREFFEKMAFIIEPLELNPDLSERLLILSSDLID